MHYQYNLQRVFSNTIELPIPWMRKITTMDILMRRYFLNIKFGELSLINVALKTLMQRVVAELVGIKQAEIVKSNRFKTIYKCVLFLRKLRPLKQDFKVILEKTLEDYR